jgi:hypothetical protein
MTRPYRKFTKIEVERIKRLREMGLSYAAIGKELGRSDRAIQNRMILENGKLHKLGRTCGDCPTNIPDANKSGYCRLCATARLNKDPAFQQKRLAGLRASDKLKPGSPTRRSAAIKASATRMSNPEYVTWLREQVRTVVAPASLTPEAQAKRDRKAAGKKISDHWMSWCPGEYREAYFSLIRGKGLRRAEAKPIIEAQIKADKERARNSLSPFERQMKALENGAKLVANDQKPSLANPGVYGERVA